MPQTDKIKMYKIFADYRPPADCQIHYYYTWGYSKRQAKQRFINLLGWLKIYSIDECDETLVSEVKNNPAKYILI